MVVALRSRSRSANRWNIVQAASPSWGTASSDAVLGVVGRREQRRRETRGEVAPVVQRRGERLAHPPFDRVARSEPGSAASSAVSGTEATTWRISGARPCT